MIGAFFTFLVLFGLIKVFEKGRDDLDNFAIATVAIVPVLIVVVVRIVLGLLFPNPVLMLALPPLVLIGATFGILWKHLEFPIGRSIMYTVVVVIVNEALAYALAPT
ncbi:MAG: hypothetical protein R3358_06715 [Woeseiaceae bacterium]|nr:hypothetical protein [Woeseiaceae bacterium]